ncbi:hypothetical protein ANN_22861 [Periplaneta americana]|uniref:DUF4817 domain-containing protein n=1 Tax=Periplaneta americana TaxID=6978 RepID=A0ABQ8SJM1_PERAM|nr:hypothetical protein ANN_22861 [Periplaneta americana]
MVTPVLRKRTAGLGVNRGGRNSGSTRSIIYGIQNDNLPPRQVLRPHSSYSSYRTGGIIKIPAMLRGSGNVADTNSLGTVIIQATLAQNRFNHDTLQSIINMDSAANRERGVTFRSLPSKETLRGHSDSSFRGEGHIQCCVGVRLCDMYSNQELTEIHFKYGKADGNAALARRLYQERYPQRQCPDRKTFVRLHYRLCEYGKFNSPGLGRGQPRSTTPEVYLILFQGVQFGGDSGGCEHDSLYQHTKGSVASQCSSYESSPVPDLESLRNPIVACSEDIRNTPGVWDRVPRPTSRLLASVPHAKAEVNDHPTRMEVSYGQHDDLLRRYSWLSEPNFVTYGLKNQHAFRNAVLSFCTITLCHIRFGTTGHIRFGTTDLLQEYRWEVFQHSPYSPDLALSDYLLFLHLKKLLPGQHFHSDREVQTTVTHWFRSQAAEFYDTGIQKLIPRYDKCLNSGGEYIGKQLNNWRIYSNNSFHEIVFFYLNRPRETYFMDAPRIQDGSKVAFPNIRS